MGRSEATPNHRNVSKNVSQVKWWETIDSIGVLKRIPGQPQSNTILSKWFLVASSDVISLGMSACLIIWMGKSPLFRCALASRVCLWRMRMVHSLVNKNSCNGYEILTSCCPFPCGLMRFNSLDNGTYQNIHFYLNNGSTGVIVVPIQTLHIDRAIFLSSSCPSLFDPPFSDTLYSTYIYTCILTMAKPSRLRHIPRVWNLCHPFGCCFLVSLPQVSERHLWPVWDELHAPFTLLFLLEPEIWDVFCHLKSPIPNHLNHTTTPKARSFPVIRYSRFFCFKRCFSRSDWNKAI